MTTLIAGITGALLGLIGVLLGVWLNSRRERQHWLRDQKLRNAVDFLASIRHLLNRYRQIGSPGMDQEERREYRGRMQNARSALYLLCDNTTVDLADTLSQRLHQINPTTDESFVAETDEMFVRLVREVRTELSGSSLLPLRRGRPNPVTQP